MVLLSCRWCALIVVARRQPGSDGGEYFSSLLSAEEALTAGLVSRIVPDEQLEEVALAVAKQVASFSGPVTRRIKASVNDTQVKLATGLTAERNRFHECFNEHDFREGLAAFIEKRPGHFLHR